MRRFIAILLVGLGLLVAGPASAGKIEEAQRAELERVRRRVASQVHLAAFDLVDEMLWGWVTEPVFSGPTPVVLAGVTVPVGLGTGLQAMLENHISMVIAANPGANVSLVHCPTCTQMLVHSGPAGTVISRGIDNPAVWAELAPSSDQYALFVDVEAEGTFLVLRARLTKLDPDLPIVWSRTLSSSVDTPALLRLPTDLKSATAAREEYLAALRSKSLIEVPVRLGVRAYAPPTNRIAIPPPPFVWLQSGVEIATNRSRNWTGSAIIGVTFFPQAYQGFMLQGRINGLLTGRMRSLSRPDLYLFLGGAVITAWGPGVASFSNERVDAAQLLAQDAGDPPTVVFGTLQLGLDVRFGNRIGLGGYLEWLPSYRMSPNLGSFIRIGPLGLQTFGTEVSVWL